MGDPGPSGLDRTPFYPTPSPVSYTTAPSPTFCLAPPDPNVVQNRSPSGQDNTNHKAALERAFAAVNFNPAPVQQRSAASYSALHVPKRSRSPVKAFAPPFQYRAAPRQEGYHIASSGPGLSPNLPVAASFSQEAKSAGQIIPQLDPRNISPLISTQGPPVEPLSKTRVAPPRPPRSPTVYDFDQIVPPHFRSTSAPFINRFGEQGVLDACEKPSPLSATQASTAKPLLFNAEESSRSPQLVPPHEPGGYNPLKNPYIPKPKSSQPKPTKKTGIWERALRKFSDRKVSNHHSARAAISRSPSPPAPLLRPRAPTPNRARNFTHPQANPSDPYFPEALGFKNGEDIRSQNKFTNPKTLFSVTEDGTVILNADPADNNWEVEALRKYQTRSKRVFTCPDFVFEDPGEHGASCNQYQSTPQEFEEILVPPPDNTRDSQDSLRTLTTQPEAPGISQDFVRPFSWQLQNPRTSRDSAATLVATPQDTRIYRDPDGLYYSLAPRNQNYPQGVEAAEGSKGSEETESWVEIPISILENSESSPIPSEFFQGKCEVSDSQSAASQTSGFNREKHSHRLAGEVDLSKSYPESVVAVQSPRNQVRRKVRAVSKRQPASSTPKSDSYRQAYWALTGGLPTDSVCEYWTKSRDSIAGGEAGDIRDLESGENVVDRRSRSPTEYIEERSPSRGRGRVRESQCIPEEDIPREEECSIAKRKIVAQQRKLARIRRLERIAGPSDRAGLGEGITEKSLDQRREADSPRIGPERPFSAAKRGAERRRKLAAASNEGEASAPTGYFDTFLDPDTPLEQSLAGNSHSVDVQRYSGEGVDGGVAASSDCAPPIPKWTSKRLTHRPRQYSSQVRSLSGPVL